MVCTGSCWNLSTIHRLLKETLKYIIRSKDLDINILTTDNGGVNNKLSEILPKEIMYNCHPYCSDKKRTLENGHGIVRRVIPKGVLLDESANKISKYLMHSSIITTHKTFNRIKIKANLFVRYAYPWNE